MKNLKKFFAFSIATAMVAGAVWGITPALKLLAYNEDSKFNWNTDKGAYVEDANGQYSYTQVKDSGKKIDGKYEGGSDVGGSDVGENPGGSGSDVGENPGGSGSDVGEITYPDKLSFKNVDPEKGLTIKVGETIELAVEGAEDYSSEYYKYYWEVGSDKSQEEIATVTENGKIIGKITGQAEGQGYVMFTIIPRSENSDPLSPVDGTSCLLEVVSADTKETTTEVESSSPTNADPKAPTSEAQAKQEQTPESIANYQTWLATYGGGTTAAAGTTTVSGTVGQPGSEAIVNTGTGEPVAMFQSNDTTNTLLAAPVGVVPSGTKIETVEAGKDSAVFKAAQNKLATISRRGTVQKVYGIAGLNSDGSLLTTINGKAAMSMPLPSDVSVPAGKSLKVYLIDDNGQTTKLDTAIDQGRVVFEIPKFGTFAFVVE